MLERYHRLARRLWPLRMLVWGLALAAAALFFMSLFGPEDWRRESLPAVAVALALWAVVLGGLIYGLRAPLPHSEPSQGRWQRLLVRVRRFGLTGFALALTVLGVLAVLSSARLVSMTLLA